jgi:large subunit ribosomal protein L25
MKEFNLYAKLRETSTQGDLNKLRKQGFVPGILYGKNKNLNIYCFITDLKDLIYTSEVYKVNVKVENKIYKTILSEMQVHPLTDIPTHLDFMEITDDKVVKMIYPIIFKGIPVGAKQGGKVFRKMKKIHLKGKLSDMPETFDLDITHLNLGDSIRIKDLKVPKIEILDHENTTIVTIAKTRVIEEAPAVAAPAAADTEKKAE